MSKKNYLLEPTTEAQTIKTKVLDLLLSTEIDNQILALNILKGGGLPPEMLTAVLALYALTEEEKIAHIISELIGEEEEYWKIINNLEKYLGDEEELLDFLEETTQEAQEFFQEYGQIIDKKQFTLFSLRHKKMGLRYCLQEKILPEEEALRIFIQEGELDISHKKLFEIPKAIANLKEIYSLDLNYNPIEDVPDELAQLTNLTSIYHYNVPFTKEALQKLETFFPKIYAEQYHNEAGRAYTNDNKEVALEKIHKTLALYPMEANYWITKGAIMAKFENNYQQGIEDLQKAIEISEKNAATDLKQADTLTLAWANIAAFYRIIENNTESLACAEKGLEVYQKYPNASLKWEEVLYFRKAHALFHMERLEESLLVYQTGLRKYPKDSSMLYNVACIYARWHQKEAMLTYLQKAIEIKDEHKEEAAKDSDFKDYWQDEGFLELIKREEA